MYIYHIQYCRFVWTKVHFETYRYLLITPICNHQLQVKSLPSNYQFESEVPHIHPQKTNMDRGHEIRKKKIFSKFRTILRYLCRDASAQRHQQKQQQTLGESWQKRILLDPANYDFPEFNSFAPKHCVPKHHFSGRYVRAWWWNHLCLFLWGLKWPRVQTMSGKKTRIHWSMPERPAFCHIMLLMAISASTKVSWHVFHNSNPAWFFIEKKILHLGRELEVSYHLGAQSKQGKIANVFSICNLNGEWFFGFQINQDAVWKLTWLFRNHS